MPYTKNYDLDTDTTLGGDNASDYVTSSQRAIRTYINNHSGSSGANTDLSNLSATGEAHFLKNTATSTNSLTIGGTSSTATYSTNIGIASSVSGSDTIAVGYNAKATNGQSIAIGTSSNATGQETIAIGETAKATATKSIQIGNGINSTEVSFNVGFGTYNNVNANYQLLDGTTGLIPDARLSTNIQRTSTAVTHPANTAVGSSSLPVHINSSGVATACTYGIKTIYTSGTSGYVIYSNGFCIQWGKSTSKTSGSQAVSLSKIYANTNYQIQTTVYDDSVGAASSAVISAQTSSSFSVIIVRVSPSASGQRALDFNWLAMGQLASGQY